MSRDLKAPVRRGRVVLVIALAVLAFGVVGLLRLDRSREAVVEPPAVRVPLFVDPGIVEHEARFRSTFDRPETLARLRAEEHLDEVVAGAETDERLVRALTSWTAAQWDQGAPNPYPPPDARVILEEIRAGRTGGFCAQYCFVLAQAAQSFGMPARLVTIRGHVVVEAWLRDERRWVAFDPGYDLEVVDPAGRPLSALEVRQAVERGEAVSLSAGHRCPLTAEAYAASYRDLGVWIRNDFVGRPLNYNDIPRYQVWFDPSPDLPLPADALTTSYAVDLWSDPG